MRHLHRHAEDKNGKQKEKFGGGRTWAKTGMTNKDTTSRRETFEL